jgi:Raf kinase inhibitor-like YbhB/YbcL family protein
MDGSQPPMMDAAPPTMVDAAPKFTLEATNLTNNTFADAQVASELGCTGGNQSPGLRWSNPPAGAKSFVLTMYDPDAPTGSGFWHWTLFNIPPSTTSIAPNAAASQDMLPPGSAQGYVDFGRPGYGGPCPPSNKLHHYVFNLTAVSVDALPGISESSPASLVAFTANSLKVGASATYTATYLPNGDTQNLPVVPDAPGFMLTSDDVSSTFDNKFLLDGFGCTGMNVSPELRWTPGPTDTMSYALTLYDRDAPTVYDAASDKAGFWHWLAFDIQSNVTMLAQGASAPDGNPAPSLGGGVQAKNDTGTSEYAGPCPPAGSGTHHYTFTVYALPVPHLGVGTLTGDSTGGLLGFQILSTATAKASFEVDFAR